MGLNEHQLGVDLLWNSAEAGTERDETRLQTLTLHNMEVNFPDLKACKMIKCSKLSGSSVYLLFIQHTLVVQDLEVFLQGTLACRKHHGVSYNDVKSQAKIESLQL